ncbi:MAG: LodA/GoxA family CTQ-dependent oxidase [Bacteroidetes bacterium]|nr:LodA/GoxA family CTQ-dependent oxidase [Bacteroidota bacterium]
MATIYKIYPSIGIARIGKSDKFFIGPESPSMPVKGPFKENGKIKKQGARFRVYEFEVDEFGGEKIVGEVTDSKSVKIEWNVHLCNRKAASRRIPTEPAKPRNPGYKQDKLVIEGSEQISGKKKISSPIIGQIQFINKINDRVEGKDDVVLGRLETDNKGRLIVIGGSGVAKSLLNIPLDNFANNPGWYDDCCDGPVEANIQIDGCRSVEAQKAWVVVASPAYAPEIKNVITWYDQAKNIDANTFNPVLNIDKPSFTNDIYPILKSTVLLQWVHQDARRGHGSGRGNFIDPQILKDLSNNSNSTKSQRQHILSRLMEPNTGATGPGSRPPGPKSMPFLFSGVDPRDRNLFQYASLTKLQYSMMGKWVDGDFSADWKGEPAQRKFDNIPIEEQPEALTRAALEGCIGGPFFPGIETTYIMALADTYEAPYRINQTLPAGYMTELMALPWQADFIDCGALWWPAQRPVSVKTKNGIKDFSRGMPERSRRYAGMVKNWNELGFVVKVGNSYIETERGSIP